MLGCSPCFDKTLLLRPMKRLLSLLLPAIFIASCKPNNSGGLSGNWVNEKYITEIQSDTPARNAQNLGMVLMFPKKFNDSVVFVSAFHDGTYIALHKEDSGYSLGLSIMNKKDAAEHLTLLPNGKLSLGGTIFVKIPADTTIAGLPLVLEEYLFKGKYDMLGKEVEFTANGRIKGMDNLGYYWPRTDYYDEGLNLDQVELGRNPDDKASYGFTFKKDTLLIYTLRCKEYDSAEHMCGLVEYDKLLYRMVKKK
jgi:hypothetical protein